MFPFAQTIRQLQLIAKQQTPLLSVISQYVPAPYPHHPRTRINRAFHSRSCTPRARLIHTTPTSPTTLTTTKTHGRSSEKMLYFDVKKADDLRSASGAYDGVIYVCTPEAAAAKADSQCPLAAALSAAAKYDPTAAAGVGVLPLRDVPGGRMVYASTGAIDPDYHDVRQFRDAAAKAVKKALAAGVRKPLVYLHEHAEFPDADLVTLLAVFEALYIPLQVRELKPSNLPKIDYLGVAHRNPAKVEELIALAKNLEAGRIVARDIGDGDPERMAPPRVRKYVEEMFKETNIKVTVVDDEEQIKKEYPLFEAVDRSARRVPRHRGCIMYLDYTPPAGAQIKETLMFVGKGVTYDTGGADIKAGGVMAGMSRDKCGAAAVAGFMKVVERLQPKNVRIFSAIGLVRNSVGSECYVSDELIKARSGELVRIGNTDAEGRMIMADPLCRMKELAVDMINPHLFTVATLTGHACLAVGLGYNISVDNGPARKANVGGRLQKAGELVGDPFEISTMRREDLQFHRGTAPGDDIMQSNNLPSSRTPRGHQTPAAFLLLASGLDKYGSGSATPLKYSHLDIAASGGHFPEPSTAAPVLALTKAFLL